MRKATIAIGLAGSILLIQAARADGPPAPDRGLAAAVPTEAATYADKIVNLAAADPGERAAAVNALAKIGKPAAPALVKALGDPRNDLRAGAAEALRIVLAADPASAPNCHTEADW